MMNSTRRWNSLHGKLLRTILISFSVGIIISGIMLFIVGNNIAKANLIDSLSVTGKILADRSAAPLIFMDKSEARESLTPAKNRQIIDFLCLYDDKGVLFSHYANKRIANYCQLNVKPAAATEVVEGEGMIGITVPVIEKSDLLGQLYIQANTKVLVKAQWGFAGILLLALLISLVIAYFLGGRLVRHSLIPLKELYNTATVIAKNPLSDMRAAQISEDEIGRVVNVFNSMLDTLAVENQALTLSENRFRSLSENSPIGVFLKNDFGEYEYTNSRWTEITGLDSACASSFASFVSKADRKEYKQVLEHVIEFNEPGVAEFRYLNPEHGERTLMEYLSPVGDESGGQRFIGSLLDVTDLKLAQLELEKLAFYDPLTQLPNRRFFRDQLDLSIARAKKEKSKVAIYMTDLDEFKKVNDSLGHDAGDQLLIDIAQRLRDALYEGDVVSRMGGDEFLIILDHIEDPSRLDHASARLLEALQTTVEAGNEVIQVSGSIGISIYPTDSEAPDELLRYADMALYNAKESGGNRASYYSRELDQKIKEKIRLEHKLREAINNRCLEVYIQPQYESDSRRMTWGEALIRWNDKEEGFIPPDLFIPLAEDAGLIYEIGDFVLETVLKTLSQHQRTLEKIGLNGVSVNLSAKQFFSPNFHEKIAAMFRHYKIEPSMVEFEVTETTVMDDVDYAIVVMQQLRDLGCKLSIDDFGTGYSSLSYLKRFPITSLKIDRTFISDIPENNSDVQICCAIIAMAKSLGLSVVAEGVETEIQAKFLATNECEYLQGYYLDRPMPIPDLLNRTNKQKKIVEKAKIVSIKHKT